MPLVCNRVEFLPSPVSGPKYGLEKNVPEMFQFCAKNWCQTVALGNKPKIKKPGNPGFFSLAITSCSSSCDLVSAVRFRPWPHLKPQNIAIDFQPSVIRAI
jgi:hypothetical protein